MGYDDHNIYNAIEWARKKIEGTAIKDSEQMVTMDVKEMFNNINTDLLVRLIKININDKMFNISIIMEMIKYDLFQNNYVKIKDNIYEQIKGVPMGSPSSAIYANIYIDYFIMLKEEEIKANGIRMMYKNVDDIFMITEKGKWKDILMKIGKDMKLDLKCQEENEEGEIEFLDIIIKREEDHTLTIRHNRKDHYSTRTVHKLSSQDELTKKAVILSKLQRTFDLSSEKYVYDAIQINIADIMNNQYGFQDVVEFLNEIVLKNGTHESNKVEIIKECIETVLNQARIRLRKRDYGKLEKNQERLDIGSSTPTQLDELNTINIRTETNVCPSNSNLAGKIKRYNDLKLKKKIKKDVPKLNRNKITKPKGKFIRIPHMTGKRSQFKNIIGQIIKNNKWQLAVKARKNQRVQNIVSRNQQKGKICMRKVQDNTEK